MEHPADEKGGDKAPVHTRSAPGAWPGTDLPHKTRRRNTTNLQWLRNELLGQIQQGLLTRLPNG